MNTPELIAKFTRDVKAGSDGAKALGRRIRVARRRLGLNARELAVMAGCSPTTIYHTEVGRYVPGAELLWRIAMATGQSVDDLLALPPASASAEVEPKQSFQSLAALAETLGYPAASVAKPPEEWPEPVRETVAALAAFWVAPTPGNLAAVLRRHPMVGDERSAPQLALTRLLAASNHSDLIDLMLHGSDIALDSLEDLARRVIPAIDRRGTTRRRK